MLISVTEAKQCKKTYVKGSSSRVILSVLQAVTELRLWTMGSDMADRPAVFHCQAYVFEIVEDISKAIPLCNELGNISVYK